MSFKKFSRLPACRCLPNQGDDGARSVKKSRRSNQDAYFWIKLPTRTKYFFISISAFIVLPILHLQQMRVLQVRGVGFMFLRIISVFSGKSSATESPLQWDSISLLQISHGEVYNDAQTFFSRLKHQISHARQLNLKQKQPTLFTISLNQSPTSKTIWASRLLSSCT